MDKLRQKKIDHLRNRFNELAEALNHVRQEWLEARDRKDVDREIKLITKETEIFSEINEIIGEYSDLMRHASEAL